MANTKADEASSSSRIGVDSDVEDDCFDLFDCDSEAGDEFCGFEPEGDEDSSSSSDCYDGACGDDDSNVFK